ncbi:hypothetical protein F5B18DRAFT_599988 [Nemania serpens]|nr:hypothetical protein F5B18DRAFT_599988 [Nemania serpens]
MFMFICLFLCLFLVHVHVPHLGSTASHADTSDWECSDILGCVIGLDLGRLGSCHFGSAPTYLYPAPRGKKLTYCM